MYHKRLSSLYLAFPYKGKTYTEQVWRYVAEDLIEFTSAAILSAMPIKGHESAWYQIQRRLVHQVNHLHFRILSPRHRNWEAARAALNGIPVPESDLLPCPVRPSNRFFDWLDYHSLRGVPDTVPVHAYTLNDLRALEADLRACLTNNGDDYTNQIGNQKHKYRALRDLPEDLDRVLPYHVFRAVELGKDCRPESAALPIAVVRERGKPLYKFYREPAPVGRKAWYHNA